MYNVLEKYVCGLPEVIACNIVIIFLYKAINKFKISIRARNVTFFNILAVYAKEQV